MTRRGALAVRLVGGVWIAVACGGHGEVELQLSEGTPGPVAPDGDRVVIE
jgi:hypothetical protein